MDEADQRELPDTPYVAVADFADLGSAEVIASLLRSEGMHAKAEPRGLLAGLASHYAVLVPEEVAHRARWILRESEFTDGELAYLATGRLGSDHDS